MIHIENTQKNLSETHASGECFVYLARSDVDILDKDFSPIPLLRKELYGYELIIGLRKNETSKLIASLRVPSDPGSNFNIRWVCHLLLKEMMAIFAGDKVTFVGGAFNRQVFLAVVEDFYFSFCASNRSNTKSINLRIMVAKDELENVDPYREFRLEGGNAYRDWINCNPDEMTSLEMARRLGEFAKQHDCFFECLGETELEENELKLLLAVGRAYAYSPPRLIVLHNSVKSDGETTTLLIGKGVTFDSGGINLKPHEAKVNCMKNDMGGAALTANLFMNLVRSGYDKPLALAIPACENNIDRRSVKPGSIIKTASGKKVIIEHTDAEGRLILADAIHYAQTKFKPEKTIVAATLTSACLTQFSSYITPVHFASKKDFAHLEASFNGWGEEIIRCPSLLPFQRANESDAADLTNLAKLPRDASHSSGSMNAAHFLKQFASCPLIHFDIFGSTWNWSGDYPGTNYGATGAPFNGLFQALRSSSS